MTVATGTAVYELGQRTVPCSGKGVAWTDEELDAALGGRVAGLVFDDEGASPAASLLGGVSETGFEQSTLQEIFNNPAQIENSRVGEAIAEAYLSDHCECVFPWPMMRDQRKRGSSLPGADLVGFVADNQGRAMVFGEVKTSAEAKYPPSVMHGSTGLKKQLADLRDCKRIRDDLVKYLCYRARTAKWLPLFQEAVRRYVQDTSDVRLYGVLIRDVEPRESDLRACVAELGNGRPENTRIGLLALYLPAGRIATLGARIARGSQL